MRSESSYHENQLLLSKHESAANKMFQKTLNAYLKNVNHLIQDDNTTVEKMSIPSVIIGKDFRIFTFGSDIYIEDILLTLGSKFYIKLSLKDFRRKHDFKHLGFQADQDTWLDIPRGFIQR